MTSQPPLPDILLANMGTPLMWMNLLHLLIGNAVIALVEGLLIAKCFGVRRLSAIGCALLANYGSAWLGGWLFPTHLPGKDAITILNLHTWLWQAVTLAFLFTLVLEFPFFWLALRKRHHPIRSTVWGTLLANAISYPLLAYLFGSSSSTSMLTRLEVLPPCTMDAPKDLRVYFLSPDDQICVLRPHSKKIALITRGHSPVVAR